YKQQYLELGTRTLVDLLNSEQEYHRAQVDVVNNRFDIIQTQLECSYRQGKLAESLNIYAE
ncbi:MAG: TolC family protein, partial [Wohlfahrtiimonas sp.]